MTAKVLVLSSQQPGAGKTHFAAGLACWLHSHGRPAAPLLVAPRDGGKVVCPDGDSVSRATAVLAEACGLAPSPLFEGGWQNLPHLREAVDVVIVEAASGTEVPAPLTPLSLTRTGNRIEVDGFPALPMFGTDLMPSPDPELDALAPFSLSNSPRTGVISLPHIANFGELQLIRGAEWLTSPAPGRFAVLFIPATADAGSDAEWLRENGLEAWLKSQESAGCRVICSDWPAVAGEQIPIGMLRDSGFLSRLLGRRIAPPLPDEQTKEQLAAWFASWPGLAAFDRAFLPGV